MNIEQILEHYKPKRWNPKTEEALRKLKPKPLTLEQKKDIMERMFPALDWTINIIASKEKRV